MKDKDALESERKSVSQMLDKQTKTMDKLLESERASKALLVSPFCLLGSNVKM